MEQEDGKGCAWVGFALMLILLGIGGCTWLSTH